MNALTVLALLGAIQGAVLGLALLTIRRGNRHANAALAVFVLMFSAVLCTQALLDLDVYQRLPHLMLVAHPLMLAFGPLLLLLYVLFLTSRAGSLHRLAWLNLIPFAAHVAFLTPFYLRSAEYKLELLVSPEQISFGEYALTTLQILHL